MKIIKGLLLLAIIGGLATASWATPIINIAGDGKEDRSNGSVYDYYQNSGALLFVQQGNNNGQNDLAAVQQLTQNALGDQNLILTITGSIAVTFYSDDQWSGTWSTTPAATGAAIEFYAVKAGNYFAMYEVDPADSTGSWSTFDIWSLGGAGTGGHPRNGGGGLEISHFTAYNPNSAVPEPGTILLFGSGLVGVVLFRKIYGRANNL